MGCVASTAAVSGSYLAGANTFVYNAKQTDLMVGWNPFTFDNYYDWDGVSNILLDICYALPSGENLVYTKDAATAFASTCTDGTNGAGGSSFSCSAGSPFTSVYSKRANTKFGTCEPKTTVLLNYTWTPSSSLSSSTIYNPVATPAATTTYTVSVAPPGNASCISTSSVSVTVDNLNPAINPNAVTVCPPGTPSAVLTASAAPSAPFNGPITFSSTNNNVAFPDNTPAGINNTINVVGVTPTTLATNPVVKVCTNVTHGNVSQVTAALTSPFGTKIVLYNAAGTGANFTNTCFVTAAPAITTGAAPYTGSFAPNAAFQTTGNVNGNWILNIADNASPFIGNVAGGTLNNWNITFNTTTNSAINYQWINTTTGLSSTTIAAPTASPTATTTYTVKITDALGCTGTTTAVVGYCVAVPINLSNELTATRIGSAVNLIWQTAQEINNAYFDVEKSNDGINFITLTRLNGQGTTSAITNYSYLDAKPNTGINYYRLKQIDFNGDLKYTNIVGIFFSSNYQNLEMNGLSPIPVLDVLNYKLFALYNGEVTVTITDISGKIIHTEKQNAISGMNDFSINVNSLQQGSYILKSIQNGQTDVKRFVK
jgi:subtilisin-like proprotein convertase family protein